MNKTSVLLLFLVAVALAFAPAPKADAQTFSTANWAYPMPVKTDAWNSFVRMASSTYDTYNLTAGVARALSTVTGGFIPAGTKTLRVYAVGQPFVIGHSGIGPAESGNFYTIASGSYFDLPCDPLSPNSGTCYFVNAASATTSTIRFYPMK